MQPDEMLTGSMRQEEDGRREMEHDAYVTRRERFEELRHSRRDLPTTVKSNLLITTVRVEESPGHDHVHVWNRGGKSGVLTVNKGDGKSIARLLLPKGEPS